MGTRTHRIALGALLLAFSYWAGFLTALILRGPSPQPALPVTPSIPLPPPSSPDVRVQPTTMPVRLGPSIVEIDQVMQDEARTELQRAEYLQAAIGTTVRATGTIVDVRASTAYSPTSLWLDCSVPSGDAKQVTVNAEMDKGSLPILARLQKGQVVTVEGQLQRYEVGERPLFGGKRFRNGSYSLGVSRIPGEAP
jgi:hypothetical protein